MNVHELAQARIRSGRSIVCGYTDPETNTMPVYNQHGLWFTIDFATGATINPPPPVELPLYGPEEPYYRALHRQADAADTVCRCYFIGGDEGRIKIGYSVDPQSRRRDLQRSSPVDLHILALAPGGIAREAAYHEQFAGHRAHGEWFERVPEILAEIDRLAGRRG